MAPIEKMHPAIREILYYAGQLDEEIIPSRVTAVYEDDKVRICGLVSKEWSNVEPGIENFPYENFQIFIKQPSSVPAISNPFISPPTDNETLVWLSMPTDEKDVTLYRNGRNWLGHVYGLQRDIADEQEKAHGVHGIGVDDTELFRR